MAASRTDRMEYHVFFIFTDGELHDYNKSAAWLKEASELPLSIIFIGIGKENFTNVDQLSKENFQSK